MKWFRDNESMYFNGTPDEIICSDCRCGDERPCQGAREQMARMQRRREQAAQRKAALGPKPEASPPPSLDELIAEVRRRWPDAADRPHVAIENMSPAYLAERLADQLDAAIMQATAQDKFQKVVGNDYKATLGRYSALNWGHLKRMVDKHGGEIADTIVWLVWQEVITANRADFFSKAWVEAQAEIVELRTRLDKWEGGQK